MSIVDTSARSFPATLRAIFKQAWPILISQWASMAFGVLDTAMTGHAGPIELATMALSISIYITVFVGLMGVMHALIPIQAQFVGAGKLEQVGRAWGQGIWVSILLSVVGGAVMLFPDVWLSFSGDIDPQVRSNVKSYLLALTFALPAALMFRTVYALANAVSRPKLVMMINLVGIALKVFFNWLLIFGNWGLPELGATGAGISSAIVFWINLAVGLWIVTRTPFYKQFHLKLGRPQLGELWSILRLGIPMGGSYLVEVSAFTFMALLVAQEGTAVIGGHQITSNLAALAYMMPMAIGVATAALAAQSIGAGQLQQAHRTSMMGLVIGLGGALITACGLYFGRDLIVATYTSDPAVAAIALSLLALLPFFHIVDAMQCINSYLLRAHKIAVVPLILQFFALMVVGLLGGWWLGFGPGKGLIEPLRNQLLAGSPVGAGSMWLMATIGLAISAMLLHGWYRHIVKIR
ncbi:MATE family efflux transporter [Zwartia sp.]|uniref:MATE family efflux transporter n=1 Tax=Zwartia sp. TaxID=2978004 RepID=UPI002727DF50|nr:MATE family efflux transporter [Zwartia sp.]MDO9026163.1 MATE family efflux transporter [Zwartia sp.]